jgi:hypothetical protein
LVVELDQMTPTAVGGSHVLAARPLKTDRIAPLYRHFRLGGIMEISDDRWEAEVMLTTPAL